MSSLYGYNGKDPHASIDRMFTPVMKIYKSSAVSRSVYIGEAINELIGRSEMFANLR